jgi:hypothetical protein
MFKYFKKGITEVEFSVNGRLYHFYITKSLKGFKLHHKLGVFSELCFEGSKRNCELWIDRLVSYNNIGE